MFSGAKEGPFWASWNDMVSVVWRPVVEEFCPKKTPWFEEAGVAEECSFHDVAILGVCVFITGV